MRVFVVDTRDPVVSRAFIQAANSQWGAEEVIPVTPLWSMNRIVNRIKDLTSPGSLSTLYLCGHGAPGYIELGSDGLTVQSARQFAVLRNEHRFDESGSIEIHACAFASATPIACTRRQVFEVPIDDHWATYPVRCVAASRGTIRRNAPGRPILQEIADQAEVPVTAGVDAQRPDGRFRWEGPTVTVAPRLVHR